MFKSGTHKCIAPVESEKFDAYLKSRIVAVGRYDCARLKPFGILPVTPRKGFGDTEKVIDHVKTDLSTELRDDALPKTVRGDGHRRMIVSPARCIGSLRAWLRS